jgi:hypothetical protein
MSATHVDADAWVAVVEASDGDPVNQTAWRQADGPLADRSLWLRNRILGGVTGGKFELPLVPLKNANDRFTFKQPGGGSVSYVWQQTDVTDAGELVFPVCVPFVKGNVTKVTAYVHGKIDSGSSHAGVPGTLPKITLLGRNYAALTAGGSVFSVVTDPSASLVAYEADHVIEYTGAPVFAVLGGASSVGYIKVEGEAGANNAADKFGLGAILLEVTPIP